LLLKKGITNSKINSILEIVLGNILLLMTVLIFLQVVFRYVLNMSLSWSEELARFLQIGLTLIGSAYAIKQKIHISLGDSITRKLPNRIKMIVPYIIDVLVLAFTITVLIQGIEIVRIVSYQTSASIGIPMMYVYAVIPVSAALSIFYIIAKYMKKKS